MRKKVGQSLAAVAVILTITSMTGAGAYGAAGTSQAALKQDYVTHKCRLCSLI